MLFYARPRDNLAELTLLEPVVKRLGRRHRCILSRRPIIPSMCWCVRDGMNSDVMNEVLDTLAD